METGSRINKIAIPIGIVLFSALFMMGLIAIKAKPKKSTPENPGVLVTVQKAKKQDWQITVNATGIVRSSQEISIVPQVSGAVISISPGFAEGGFFKKGETLMKIDSTDYNLVLRQALSAKARAEYELEQIKSRAEIARREWGIISGGTTVPANTQAVSQAGEGTVSQAGEGTVSQAGEGTVSQAGEGAVSPAEEGTVSQAGEGAVSPAGEGAVSPAGEGTVSPNPLVLYEPQMKNARAALESAEATVEMARLNLERTIIRAPFDCRIRTKSVDLGQYIRAGNPLAVVAGTEAAEVAVPLDRAELAWVDIPGPSYNAAKRGSLAEITIPGGTANANWTGHVTRSAGEVDMRNRTVQIIIQVDDPYGLMKANRKRPPLMDGAFVNVSLKGRQLANVYSIPRPALRDDDTLWLMDSDGKLITRKVSVLRIEKGTAIIGQGLDEDDTVVLSRVSGAADGMKLRTALRPDPSMPVDSGAVINNAPADDAQHPALIAPAERGPEVTR